MQSRQAPPLVPMSATAFTPTETAAFALGANTVTEPSRASATEMISRRMVDLLGIFDCNGRAARETGADA